MDVSIFSNNIEKIIIYCGNVLIGVMTNTPVKFDYEKPEVTHPKMVKTLCETDLARGGIQVVREDGATNRHSHSGHDGFWWVIEGKATFYTGVEENEETHELDKREGILIPHGHPYWFENSGEDELEILHIMAKSEEIDDKRTNYEERKEWQQDPSFAWFE